MLSLRPLLSLPLILSVDFAYSETLTISRMGELNLLEGKNATLKRWNLYPDGTPLITINPDDEKPDQAVILMRTGVAVLAVHSQRVPVEPDTAYSLAYEIRQQSIPIGFGMGGGPTIRWFDGTHPSAKVLFFEKLDGSFDWQTVSYSFVSPPDAREVQISLGKTGAPGEIAFRNVRFAKGTLKRSLGERRARDFATEAEAFDSLSKRLEIFHAVRGVLTTNIFKVERAAIIAAATQGRETVLRAATEHKAEISPALTHEVVWAEMLKGSQGFQVTPDSPNYEKWSELRQRGGGLLCPME